MIKSNLLTWLAYSLVDFISNQCFALYSENNSYISTLLRMSHIHCPICLSNTALWIREERRSYDHFAAEVKSPKVNYVNYLNETVNLGSSRTETWN